jgi:hypothetical protein
MTDPSSPSSSLPRTDPDAPYPPLPAGWGAVEVTFDFTSEVVVESGGVPVEERPNHETWVDPPVLTIDDQERRAGWLVWLYPLPAGPHRLGFRSPAAAERTVEVAAGQVNRISYRAEVVFRKDQAEAASPGGPITGVTATGKLRALKTRSV